MVLRKSRTATLTGIIIPTDWNDQEVVAAAVATADEKEYRIDKNRKGKELLAYLQRQVEATGALGKDEKGRALITVTRYIVK
jgi:hypothetical protein